MKHVIKILTISSLTIIFAFSALTCCCFIETVEAKEPVQSCHQTTDESNTTQDIKECGCDQTLTVVKKEFDSSNKFLNVMSLDVDQDMEDQISISSIFSAYQAPPICFDPIPLYIKHSILRI